MRWRIHVTPSGSSPLTGSSKTRTSGSPMSAEALAHAQGERPDAGAADVFEPDRGQAMIDSSGSDAVAAGHAEKMAACRLARMAGARFEKRADCAQGSDQPRIGAAVDERSTR